MSETEFYEVTEIIQTPSIFWTTRQAHIFRAETLEKAYEHAKISGYTEFKIKKWDSEMIIREREKKIKPVKNEKPPDLTGCHWVNSDGSRGD